MKVKYDMDFDEILLEENKLVRDQYLFPKLTPKFS